MPEPQLIDGVSAATFAGASALVITISGVIRRVTQHNWPAIPLVVALVVTFIVAANQNTLHTALDFLVAIGNACLLFMAAVGGNETIVAGAKERPANVLTQHAARPPVPFLTSWFD